MTLASLINRAEKAQAKADAALQLANNARIDMNDEARHIVWAELAKRGISKGDRIGFTDPKRDRWLASPARLDRIEVYRGRDMLGKPEWRIRLLLTRLNARGKPLLTPKTESFEVQHPRDIARRIVKVA